MTEEQEARLAEFLMTIIEEQAREITELKKQLAHHDELTMQEHRLAAKQYRQS